jgi:hypothetical protein
MGSAQSAVEAHCTQAWIDWRQTGIPALQSESAWHAGWPVTQAPFVQCWPDPHSESEEHGGVQQPDMQTWELQALSSVQAACPAGQWSGLLTETHRCATHSCPAPQSPLYWHAPALQAGSIAGALSRAAARRSERSARGAAAAERKSKWATTAPSVRKSAG